MQQSSARIRCARCLTLLLLWGGVKSLPADVIRLTHGGTVRGELLEQEIHENGPLKLRTLSGAVVTIDRTSVEYVQRRSRVVEEYESQAKQIPHTIEAHRDLAEWCRSHLLKEQRADQLELLLELDPDDRDARRVLGHVKHNGEWMTRDEMMLERGYVKYNRKWITTQERDLLEKTAAEREAEVAWYPRVRLWFAWITSRDAARKKLGLDNFAQVTDPDAVPALTQVLGNHADDDVRLLYVQVLGNLEGLKAVPAIVGRFLLDSNATIRAKAFEVLRSDQYEAAVPLLISGLKNDQNHVVRQAATGLASIGDAEAIPYLIDALVTTHKYQVQVPTGNAISFGTGANGRVGSVTPNALPPEVEAMARTGQFPHGAIIIPHSATPRLTKTRTVKVDVKNPPVLQALTALTNNNFGYNERDWQLWWSLQKG